QMLVGVGVFVAASLAARQLELHSVGWLVDTLWSFWVVVLVVLFQPELRRALTTLGHAGALRALFGGAGAETLRVVDEIASVAGSLAERRIGALIVIERGTGLRQYAELGVALDALVSADLLTSLFLPYSPLHDGAAFIRDDRVVAAGCFLPLSRNSQLARQLGTRHRQLKLLAVVLAVVVWFFVVNANRSRFGFAAPVEYVGLEPGMVLLGQPRETVDLQVEAARWAAARLTPGEVRVRVDLSRAREGDNT